MKFYVRYVLVLVTAMWLMLGATTQAALLEGQTLTAQYLHQTDMSTLEQGDHTDIVVGPGVELPQFGFNNLVSVDVSDQQLLITLLFDQPLAFRQFFKFIDVNNMIPSFSGKVLMNATTTWAGFQGHFVNSDSEAITVGVNGLQGVTGQFILIDIVPEPSAVLLLAPGLALFIAHRRWRRRR